MHAPAQPKLLSRINERSVLRTLQSEGPASRAELTRRLGSTAPTVSKAVASLLETGLLEEYDADENGRGRPAKLLRLATQTAQVLGLVIDVEQCRLVTAGLDGALKDETHTAFETPATYDDLLDHVEQHARGLTQTLGVSTLGVGVSIPGLFDYREQKGILSPNVPVTNGRCLGRDLETRLGLPCVVLQEMHALCLAERHYGEAKGLDDFAMLEAGAGVGLGIFSGGQLLTGNSGIAGEIGHIPVDPEGRPCGCGGRGCLETVAGDAALAWEVSQSLGKKVTIEEVVRLAGSGRYQPLGEMDKVLGHLSLAMATIINLMNPSTLFVHTRMFDLADDVFDRLVEQTRRRALAPSFADCRIVQARGSKRQGAVAAMTEYLTDCLVPMLAGHWNGLRHEEHANGAAFPPNKSRIDSPLAAQSR
ncbi:MAG: ROK family transcriptional regulator [Pirellulaceae bacterium]